MASAMYEMPANSCFPRFALHQAITQLSLACVCYQSVPELGADDWQADSRKTLKVSGKFKGSRKLLRQEADPTQQPEFATSAKDARF